jgi:hypothetical protein
MKYSTGEVAKHSPRSQRLELKAEKTAEIRPDTERYRSAARTRLHWTPFNEKTSPQKLLDVAADSARVDVETSRQIEARALAAPEHLVDDLTALRRKV